MASNVITLEDFGIQPQTKSKQVVTERTALGLSPLWCGLRVLSGDVGSFEPKLYDWKKKAEDDNNPISELICNPNSYTTRPMFFESLAFNGIINAGFAEIERSEAGLPIALHLIPPQLVQIEYTGQAPIFHVYGGGATGTVPIQNEDMIYFSASPSPDGTIGFRLLTIARELLGFGQAIQGHAASLLGNNARPGGVAKHPGKLSDIGRNNLRKYFQEFSQDGAGKTLVLEEGMEFLATQHTNEMLQFSDTQRFFVTEIARLLNIPCNKLHSLAPNETSTRLEEMNASYLQTSLRPLLIKLEAELEKKLLTPEQRKNLYIEFDTSTLLRANNLERYQVYQIARSANILTVDEIRAMENLAPMPAESKMQPVTSLPPGGQVEVTANDPNDIT